MKVRNLKPLLTRGLVNAGLVELTPTMLERYNECLVSLGIPPTGRKKIYVDGVGWSPQIARERRNPYYLCVGGIINPVAIIVSPYQYKKPVYWPIFSWMRGAMRAVFERYHREIFDVTGTHVLALDCENGLTSLESPADLLLLSEITLTPNLGSFVKLVEEQSELIAKFQDGLHCLDPEVCDAIEKHRRAHGDLRKRKISMKPVTFDTFKDFYTVAFGGAAVFRDVDGSDMLVLENQNIYESIKGSNTGAVVFYLHDTSEEPTRYLESAGYLRLPTDEFRSNPQLLEEKKDLLLSLSLCDSESELDWNTCGTAKRKTLIKKHEGRVDKMYLELERFAAAIRRGGSIPEPSSELWHFLAVPAERLPPSLKEVLWILLTRKEPRRVLNLYRHDKNRFFEVYSTWTSAKQEWVAQYIADRYSPIMNLR